MDTLEVFNSFDYSLDLYTIIEKLDNLIELQTLSINNLVEFSKVFYIVLGLFIAILLGSLFVKVVFKWMKFYFYLI